MAIEHVDAAALLAVVAAALAAGCQAPAAKEDAAAGAAPAPQERFEPAWESLARYTVPQWYLDAKFGIFIHWGVYAVPAFGNEWYPRNMYRKGTPEFAHHLQTYGPQKEFGYKDFIPKFTAEAWSPDDWADLFYRSGARYVVAVAEHHDGFALYDCSRSEWTAVTMGPKRDVVGDLGRAVRRKGLKFGVSSHRAYNWEYYTHDPAFDTSDPASAGLYGRPHDPKAPADAEFLDDWYARTVELVDNYRPDVLWFDFGFLKPEYEPYRRQIAAHYYNRGLEWGRGVVLNYKHQGYPEGAAVLDIERGKLADIRGRFWQTDTSVCLRSWGYIQDHQYRSADSLVDDLADIASKNGCLLLNIGPRPDGTIPEPQREILLGIGRWLNVCGEAIYGTRPWVVFGEGPTQVKAGYFGEKDAKGFTGQDIRFTVRGDVLYAILLDWPGPQAVVRSLGTRAGLVPGQVTDVRLLGHAGRLEWSRGEDGLAVKMPEARPCEHAYVLKITGLKMEPFDGAVGPAPDGSLTLAAGRADLHGTRIRLEARGGQANVGFWDDPNEWVSWTVRFPRAGAYEVSGRLAAQRGETEFVIELAGERLGGKAPRTATWDESQTVPLGRLDVKAAGTHTVAVRPRDPAAWLPMNLALLRFEPAP